MSLPSPASSSSLPATQAPHWDDRIRGLLDELSSVQDDLLSMLQQKRDVMARGKTEELESFAQRETTLYDRLFACHQRRQELLESASEDGLPGESLARLADALPEKNDQLSEKIQESSRKVRLLQHESLANWVVAQRAVLHLSQMLEILATGGRIQPTYGNGESSTRRGNLVDREA